MAVTSSTNMAIAKAHLEPFEIVPNKQGKASIWEHFGFIKENDGFVGKTRIACKFCPRRMVLKCSGNTANLTDYVRWKHSTHVRQPSSAVIVRCHSFHSSKADYSFKSAVSFDFILNKTLTIQAGPRQFLVQFSSLSWSDSQTNTVICVICTTFCSTFIMLQIKTLLIAQKNVFCCI